MPPVRHLTQVEVGIMDRALRRSTRLIHEGELAPASTGEQPDSGTAETARSRAASIVGTWQDLHAHLYTDAALDDLELRIAHALRDAPSALASTGEQPDTTAAVPLSPAIEREALRRIAKKAPDTRLSYTAKELDDLITACTDQQKRSLTAFPT